MLRLLFAALACLTFTIPAQAQEDAPPESETYVLTGTLIAPACGGVYDVLGASVTIRDEANAIIGTATTEYTGETVVLAWQQATAARDEGAMLTVLQDALRARGDLRGAPLNAGLLGYIGAWQDRTQRARMIAEHDARVWGWWEARTARNTTREQALLREILQVDELRCVVGFTAAVPEARFYQITIGRHNAPTYAFADLTSRDFTVTLTLD